MISKNVKATVFLEGVQIPFNTMTLVMAQGQPSTLTIELMPVRELFDVKPRTLVQAFYDQGEGSRVFFEGEVVAHGFAKASSGGRMMTLTCQDFSNYWLYSYVFFLKQGMVEPLAFSLDDEVKIFTGLDSAQVNDKTQQKRIFPIRGIGDKAVQLFSGANKDMAAGIRDLLGAIGDTNAFYSTRFTKLRIQDRLFAMPDGQLRFLLDPELNEALRETLFRLDSFTPIFQAAELLLQILYQNFWPLSMPSLNPVNKNPINFAIVPSTFLTAPPRCNVIFPDLHEGFSYGRNFLAEPTRMELFTPSAIDGQPQFYFSPPGFRAILDKVKAAQSKNQPIGLQDLLISDPNPELDETLRGIVPERCSLQLDVFSRARASVLRRVTNPTEEANKTIRRTNESIVDFQFLLRKFENRAFPVQMPFNPNIHPAFPVLLLDREARLFGSPRMISHTLDGEGHASTAIQCSYARHKDVIGDVISSPPPWINRSFVPDGIGEDAFSFVDLEGKNQTVQGAYPGMIGSGMRSILSAALPVYDAKGTFVNDRKPTSQEDAANLLFGQYVRSGDKEAFVTEYTRREVETEAEALKFLGISKVNAELLDGPIYDTLKRSVIEDAKVRLVEASNAIKET